MTNLEQPHPFDANRFRHVLGHYPTGVAVVTALGADGHPIGMVVGSFTSVSLSPPLVAFLPDRKSSTYASMGRPEHFVVNVLSSDQESLCRTFASKSVTNKWADVDWRPSRSGAPVLTAAVAWVACDLHTIYDGGDHDIVIGEVVAMDVGAQALPLLFFQGGYGRFSPLSLMAPPETDLLRQLRVANVVRPVMEQVAADVGLECVAQCAVGDELVSIANASPPGGTSNPSRVGTRLPWVPPYGSLFVAWAEAAPIEGWLAKATVATDAVSPERLTKALERVRERGWSLGLVAPIHEQVDAALAEVEHGSYTPANQTRLRNLMQQVGDLFEPEDLEPGRAYDVRSIGAPVFGANSHVELAFKLFNFGGPLGVGEIDRLQATLVSAAREASTLLAACASPERSDDTRS